MRIPSRGHPDDQDIEPLIAFAQFIASSSAEFVLLLEDHSMAYAMDVLLDKKAQAIITEGKFTDFCSERDEITYRTSRQIMAKNGMPIPLPSSLIEAKKELFFAGNPELGLQIHSVGNDRITTKEVLSEAKKKLNCSELLMEQIGVRHLKKILGITIPGSAIDYARQFIEPCYMAENIPDFVKDIVSIFYANNAEPRMAARQFGGLENLQQRLYDEGLVLYELVRHFRSYGQCDAYSAEAIVNINPAKSILSFGASHGVISGNPASLPDQLVSLSHAKGREVTVDKVLLMDASAAPYNYRVMSEYHATGKLRSDVIVYDVLLKESWPIIDWLSQVSHIYGWNAPRSMELKLES